MAKTGGYSLFLATETFIMQQQKKLSIHLFEHSLKKDMVGLKS